MRLKPLAALCGLVALLALGATGAGLAAKSEPNVFGTVFDTVHVGEDVRNGTLPIVGIDEPSFRLSGATSRLTAPALAAAAPTIGEERNWVALEDRIGAFYRKRYTLKALRPNVEIWVATERRNVAGVTATGTDFRDGDCRNGPRTQVTAAQADYLAQQFSENILPKESEAFSVAPARDGSQALLGPPFNPAGPGENTVVLVDNVRDDNFFDFNNTQGFSYIAGFFSSQLNDLFDRNVMTIDAFDWLHRTGANPPNEPVPGNNCTSAPARPFLYEGVFAHEYQHLLEHYEDGDETNWINEGLSDWAQTLTGYARPWVPITQTGFDSHTQCFLGWLGVATPANPNPRLTSGPENSLTRWGDQGDGEILCDYGAAYTIMEFLDGRYGNGFMSTLHRGDANGLAGLQEALTNTGQAKTGAFEVFRDWRLMVALDGLIDDGARILGPYAESNFTTPTLDATINWDTAEAYSTAGAPSNGSDYVRLRGPSGYLKGGDIESLSFQGSAQLPPKPVAWSVAANPPFHPGDPALFSSAGNNRDEAIVRQISVPTGGGATLAFDALWNEELGWDFGFVQISNDGGSTYTSIPCTDTTTETNPDALPTAKENVPGFTGYSGGWKAETCSLASYAGQTVLLAFRTFNDPSVLGESGAVPPGFWVDNVNVGTTLISDGTSLEGWQSFTQAKPTSVANFVVDVISIDGKKINVKRLPLVSDFSVHGSANVQKYIDKKADFVAVVVSYEDPAETSDQYAPYRLTANGITQPGGA